MTSKERIRAALAGKPVDRVPTTMQCVEVTWEKLMKHFNVESIDQVQDILEIDTRTMDLPPYKGILPEPYTNEEGETVYRHPIGYDYVNKWNGIEYNAHVVTYPLDHIETMEDLDAYDGWVNPDEFDYDAVKEFCEKHKDKAIRIGWPGAYQIITNLINCEQFYIMMIEEPEVLQAILDRHCDRVLEIYRRMFEAAEGNIDFMVCCDDYGTQISLLFSPAMWDEFFAENTKRYVALCHEYNAFYMQHSCGAVRGIIPNLIACGVDALEPLQKVEGLEPAGLVADFGDKLCFQGGIDTQHILPLGTPEEVTAETEAVLRAFSPISGYILCPSQTFEGDVPIENILAMYEARKTYMNK
ncbi:MAG: uroporphyrinogen decarboxylase family protein [Eubacteriales bacterium]